MSYKDDLIADMKAKGEWDNLTTEMKKHIIDGDDDYAKSLLVMTDELEADLSMKRAIFSNPESIAAKELAEAELLKALQNIREVFNDGLISLEDGKIKLSSIAKAIAEVFHVSQEHGFSIQQTYAELHKMSFEGTAILCKSVETHSE